MEELNETVNKLANFYAELVDKGIYSNTLLNARKDGMADALHAAYPFTSWDDCRQWVSSKASTIIREPSYEYFTPLERGHDIINTQADHWWSIWKKNDDGREFVISQTHPKDDIVFMTTVKQLEEAKDVVSTHSCWHDAEESCLRQLQKLFYPDQDVTHE